MNVLRRLELVLKVTRSHGIARRYFVVNGFDGALTMLGLILGFHISEGESLSVAISSCLGAAIALGMSGLTSAYISESAEKRRELRELEDAMVTDLGRSAHARAADVVPIVIAMVNGLSPFLISLLIITPLWLAQLDSRLSPAPLESAMAVAFALMFLLGVFLGKISGRYWLWAGVRALIIAVATSGLILLVSPN